MSIKRRLISNTMLIVSIIFILVLTAISVMSINNVDNNVKKSEQNIRNALIAKGKTLVNNNSMAMRGMAEDYAITAVQNLVSSTVKDDPDIEYGIYMDVDRRAWVNASPTNPPGKMEDADFLNDPISQWAGSLTAPAYQNITYGDQEIIEFAAPVIIMDENEIMGVIRYGLSTHSMQRALKEALENGNRERNQAIVILLLLGIFSLALTYLIIWRLASTITHPIGLLVQSTKVISEGNYDIEVQRESDDEIGHLAEDFESMRVTIQKYTRHLQDLVDEKMQQVHDILNNIDHGLFTINLDGSVNKEYSTRANEILKVKDVASSSVEELLRLDSKQQRSFHLWMDLVNKRYQKQRWKKLARLAPVHELTFGDHDSIPEYVSIAYQKIYDKQNELAKIMILVTDETEKRLKDYQMEEQRKKHDNEMNIVLGLANTPPEEISAFMEDTTERMKRILQQINEYAQHISKQKISANEVVTMTDVLINTLYRDIHTIKGNSGSYGFKLLSEQAHKMEDQLDKLRDTTKTDVLVELGVYLDNMNEEVEEIQQKIKLIFGRDENVTMRIPSSHVTSITDLCMTLDKNQHSPEVQVLIDKCIMLSWMPIETITRKYQKIVNRAARKQQKSMTFVVKPEHVFYPPDIFSDIDDALIHLVRNAADHGIEKPEIREELGKGMGHITFEFTLQENSRTITLSDDGKGIDTEKLLETSIRKGVVTLEETINFTEQQKLALIFAVGVSTLDEITELSGRGVGMDIVREKVENRGGTISIDSKIGVGTTITLILPKSNTTN
ncbi:ATP-binding protein [Candidatus Parabeggiatoa sp. HSG14]|uniref:ATP-binding protein n=1 Tax=Candidatus Parabeggiatoa sp. HSG14 TaxID=3055593 RepID=UPI0025A92ED8|nr:ATP-binding protein [Thiotrichales bacterium HSG14]